MQHSTIHPLPGFRAPVKDLNGAVHDLVTLEMNVGEQFPPIPDKF